MFKTSMAISPTPTNFGPLLFASEWCRAIQTAEELDYDGIEISLREPDTELLDKLSKAVQSAGLAISAVATGQSYLHDDLSLTNLDLRLKRNSRTACAASLILQLLGKLWSS